MPAPDGYSLLTVVNRDPGGLRGPSTLGLVLHVQAGNGGLSGWFNNPRAQASSTWWAGKAGRREQYGNPDTDKFWAQSAGNSTYHSIETEGFPNEPLTPAQIESVAVAFAWGHKRYGWPLQLAEKPGQGGLIYHGAGGAAWGGHTGCPGAIRKAQRAQILARAKQIAGAAPTPTPDGDDMPTPQDLLNAPLGVNPGNQKQKVTVGYSLEIARNYSYQSFMRLLSMEAQVAALVGAVAALAKGQAFDEAKLLASIREATAAAIVDAGRALDAVPTKES